MPTILEKIVAKKKEEIADRSARVSADTLKESIKTLDRPRNFFHAVTKPPVRGRRVNLIAEVKKASPSAGVIRPDFDPVAIATQYADAGADALSVLTDKEFFQGDLDFI